MKRTNILSILLTVNDCYNININLQQKSSKQTLPLVVADILLFVGPV